MSSWKIVAEEQRKVRRWHHKCANIGIMCFEREWAGDDLDGFQARVKRCQRSTFQRLLGTIIP